VRSVKSEEAGSRRSLSDEVAQRLQRRILAGEYPPGQRLPPERELAQELGVNRSSLREALRRLEQLRLVRIKQGSGIRVRAREEASFDLVWQLVFRDGKPDLDWIRDAMELRDALLPAVLRLAVERASALDRAELARKIRAAAEPSLADEEFTSRLRGLQLDVATVSRNQVLVLLANALARFQVRAEMRRFAHVLARDREQLRGLLSRLALVVEAGDAERAERLARDLLARTTQIVFRKLTAANP
jgi:DNA-binding FadR family transcriptional regulator